MHTCDKCLIYFKKFSCGANKNDGECDCPKCQGFCSCCDMNCLTVDCKNEKKLYSNYCHECEVKTNQVRFGGKCCDKMRMTRGECVCRYIAECDIHNVGEHIGTHD